MQKNGFFLCREQKQTRRHGRGKKKCSFLHTYRLQSIREGYLGSQATGLTTWMPLKLGRMSAGTNFQNWQKNFSTPRSLEQKKNFAMCQPKEQKIANLNNFLVGNTVLHIRCYVSIKIIEIKVSIQFINPFGTLFMPNNHSSTCGTIRSLARI